MKFPYAIDLHVHTRYSHDSRIGIDKLLKHSRKIGLSGLSISDHCCVDGGLEAARRTRDDESFLVIPSVEIGTQFGDLVVMFVKEDITARNFYEIVDLARAEDLLLLLPHPKRLDLARKIGNHVDAIEVINGGCRITQNIFASFLQERFQKTRTAGSDAHQLQNVGKCTTRFQSLDQEEIRKALRNNNTQVEGMLYTAVNILKWMNKRFLHHQYNHP